jgi:DNA-directed RNA polymerase specialized sigma subunit
MERKDYLVEELSTQEKLYLKKIVMTGRNKFIEKNYEYINNSIILIDHAVLVEEDSILESVLQRCQEEVDSAREFDRALSNPALSNIVKALSLKEREVLFYLYKEKKSINETSEKMKISTRTVSRLRDKALDKIAEQLVKGEN